MWLSVRDIDGPRWRHALNRVGASTRSVRSVSSRRRGAIAAIGGSSNVPEAASEAPSMAYNSRDLAVWLVGPLGSELKLVDAIHKFLTNDSTHPEPRI